jgi:hypothetical protein
MHTFFGNAATGQVADSTTDYQLEILLCGDAFGFDRVHPAR